MNAQLNKAFFNKKTTCLLTGLQEHQLDYLIKRTSLLENKLRYSMNDVVFIAICTALKEIRLTWVEIEEIYKKSFDTIDNFKNIDYFNLSLIEINFFEHKVIKRLHPKNELSEKKLDKIELPESLKNEDITNKIFTLKSMFIQTEHKHNFYIICVYKIINEIVQKSKELDLKVDVEQILKSA